jgi:2-polyprenyl-3-methyl-5-hydroxy-6-metoxy-1,4-benzoquinol methylase
MKSPKQWLRSRLHSFVLSTVGEVVRPSDLIHLRSYFQTEVNSWRERVNAQSKELEILRRHVENVTTDVGNHLNALGNQLNALGNQIDTTNNDLRAMNAMLHELVTHHDDLQTQVKIQDSRIRAKPYSTNDIQVISSRDSRQTIGYSTNRGGEYADFIDNFRPTFEQLLDELSYVTSWLPQTGKAVDLGAGRGEMVKIMNERGLEAYGIDSNLSVVTDANRRGIQVKHQEIDDFLGSTQTSSLDAITAIQVVEHVDSPVLEGWLQQIFKLLKPNGVFIAETPNPHAIDAFKAFWIDTTHQRVYYPESLLHMTQAAGFSKAEIWVTGTQESIDERLGYAGSYTLIATV